MITQIHVSSRFQIVSAILQTFIPTSSAGFAGALFLLRTSVLHVTGHTVRSGVWSGAHGDELMISMEALLERRRFQRDHDPGLHVLNEGHWKHHKHQITPQNIRLNITISLDVSDHPMEIILTLNLILKSTDVVLRTVSVYRCNRRLHPSPRAARRRSSCPLWTEGPYTLKHIRGAVISK